MFRFLASALSSLSLIASALLIWLSDIFPERLPGSLAGWAGAYFQLFHDPLLGVFVFLMAVSVVMGSWFITEIVLGLAYSILAACIALACLLGFLSLHYPGLEHFVIGLFR